MPSLSIYNGQSPMVNPLFGGDGEEHQNESFSEYSNKYQQQKLKAMNIQVIQQSKFVKPKKKRTKSNNIDIYQQNIYNISASGNKHTKYPDFFQIRVDPDIIETIEEIDQQIEMTQGTQGGQESTQLKVEDLSFINSDNRIIEENSKQNRDFRVKRKLSKQKQGNNSSEQKKQKIFQKLLQDSIIELKSTYNQDINVVSHQNARMNSSQINENQSQKDIQNYQRQLSDVSNPPQPLMHQEILIEESLNEKINDENVTSTQWFRQRYQHQLLQHKSSSSQAIQPLYNDGENINSKKQRESQLHALFGDLNHIYNQPTKENSVNLYSGNILDFSNQAKSSRPKFEEYKPSPIFAKRFNEIEQNQRPGRYIRPQTSQGFHHNSRKIRYQSILPDYNQLKEHLMLNYQVNVNQIQPSPRVSKTQIPPFNQKKQKKKKLSTTTLEERNEQSVIQRNQQSALGSLNINIHGKIKAISPIKKNSRMTMDVHGFYGKKADRLIYTQNDNLSLHQDQLITTQPPSRLQLSNRNLQQNIIEQPIEIIKPSIQDHDTNTYKFKNLHSRQRSIEDTPNQIPSQLQPQFNNSQLNNKKRIDVTAKRNSIPIEPLLCKEIQENPSKQMRSIQKKSSLKLQESISLKQSPYKDRNKAMSNDFEISQVDHQKQEARDGIKCRFERLMNTDFNENLSKVKERMDKLSQRLKTHKLNQHTIYQKATNGNNADSINSNMFEGKRFSNSFKNNNRLGSIQQKSILLFEGEIKQQQPNNVKKVTFQIN
eukprot:403370909